MKSNIRSKSSTIGLSSSIDLGSQAASLILIVMASLLLVFGLIRPQALSGLRLAVTDIMTPAISFVTTPFQNMASAISGVSGMASLRAENAQLKSENVRLKEWYQSALMLQAENKSLQELLNLRSNPAHKYITARVISDAGNAFIKTVLLSSGRLDNVKKNQAVIAGDGVVGRIIEVGKNSSRVLLVTDINSRIPIIIEGNQQKAILSGNNSDYLSLKHLSKDTGMIEGARIITSGDGGIFPAGLPIGRIMKQDGQYIVKPYADIGNITYVRVVDAPTTDYLIRADTASRQQ